MIFLFHLISRNKEIIPRESPVKKHFSQGKCPGADPKVCKGVSEMEKVTSSLILIWPIYFVLRFISGESIAPMDIPWNPLPPLPMPRYWYTCVMASDRLDTSPSFLNIPQEYHVSPKVRALVMDSYCTKVWITFLIVLAWKMQGLEMYQKLYQTARMNGIDLILLPAVAPYRQSYS